jgi:hypothetical protein
MNKKLLKTLIPTILLAAVLIAMGAGVAFGMGYVAYGALILLGMGLAFLGLSALPIFDHASMQEEKRQAVLREMMS